MRKLTLVSVGSETKKEAKREFDFPVALITPQINEVSKNGVTTKKVTSGSLFLHGDSMKLLKLEGEVDRVTISTSEEGLFMHNSTSAEIDIQFKKKVTKVGMLKLSGQNINRIYSENDLNIFDAWYFKLEECIVDLPGEENAKVYFFTPFEKRA